MSGLLGRRPEVERQRERPSVIRLDEECEDPVFESLSPGTARSILSELYRMPMVPSELADAVGSSLQNVSYHLDNLEEAGLVEVVDQWYSEKGREMDVYAPAGGPLVFLPGESSSFAVEDALDVEGSGPAEPVADD